MTKFLIKISFFLTIIFTLITSFEWLTAKLIIYNSDFQLENKPKYLLLGHSQPECAFNDNIITDFKNLAFGGESYFYTYHKSKEVIKNNPSIETVFINFTNNSIDPKMDAWTWDCYYMAMRLENFGELFNMNAKLKMAYKNPICFGKTTSFMVKERLLKVINNDLKFSKTLGGYKKLIKIKKDKTDLSAEEQRVQELNAFDPNGTSYSSLNIDYLKKLISFCKSEGKNVVLIRTPQRNDDPYWQNEELFQELRILNFEHIPFLDLSLFPLSDHEYFDSSHLNEEGAIRFSNWFDSLLKNQSKALLEGNILIDE